MYRSVQPGCEYVLHAFIVVTIRALHRWRTCVDTSLASYHFAVRCTPYILSLYAELPSVPSQVAYVDISPVNYHFAVHSMSSEMVPFQLPMVRPCQAMILMLSLFSLNMSRASTHTYTVTPRCRSKWKCGI